MDTRQLDIRNFLLRPLRFEGTSMLPNVLLMCKLLVLLLLAHHLFEKIDDPFLPFIPFLDAFNEIPGLFKTVLRIGLVTAAFMLFFNIYVRTSSLIIGSIVLLQMLSSKPLFNNHTFVCGCALFLAGLTNNKQPPHLLIWQLSLIYFGASINKILDADWLSGAFMHNWLAVARENSLYLSISNQLPDLMFAKMLSYIAFGTEFIIGVLLLFKKWRLFAIWFIIIFHTMLFSWTAFRFGHFLESLMIILIAFLSWPTEHIILSVKANKSNLIKRLITFLDWDKKVVWSTLDDSSKNWMHYKSNKQTASNDAALKNVILYTPAFYLLLFGIDAIVYITFQQHRTTLFVLNLIFVWSVIIHMLPISWSRLFKST